MDAKRFVEYRNAVVGEVSKAIVGKDDVIERVLSCYLCSGHVLLEDVPGTGKTMLLRAFAKAVGGSFSRVQEGIACLKRHGVDYNILSVVSADVARHGRKVYGFFRKNGWDYIQFIPCMDPIDGRREPFSLSPAQYGRFLIETFGLYEQELLRGVRVSVRWFDNLIALAAGYPPESCGMTGVCACHFVMEADGSVYPCDFYVDDAHRLGNVYDTGFREMFDCETARAFVRESMQANEKCRACRWFSLCRGGCRRYRNPAEGGTPGEGNVLGLNRLCEAYEMFFSECADRVVRLAQRMKE